MNKTVNFSLIKSLIESDFLLLDSKIKKSIRYSKTKIQINSKQKITSLDTLQLIKKLKQFVRLLQFFKTQNNPILHIWVDDKQHLNLLDLIFNEKKLKCQFIVKSGLLSASQYFDFSNLLLVLGKALNNDKNLFKRLFNNNIFLISKINAGFEKKGWGAYKIYNDLNDYKKVVFLSILIHQVFNKE